MLPLNMTLQLINMLRKCLPLAYTYTYTYANLLLVHVSELHSYSYLRHAHSQVPRAHVNMPVICVCVTRRLTGCRRGATRHARHQVSSLPSRPHGRYFYRLNFHCSLRIPLLNANCFLIFFHVCIQSNMISNACLIF